MSGFVIENNSAEEGEYREGVKTQADAALEDFLDKARIIGGTAELLVNKCSGGLNSRESQCGRFAVDKYSYFELIEVLQKTWGAGDYRIYLVQRGKKGALQNTLVTVEKSIEDNRQVMPTQDGTLQTVIKMMQENTDRLLEALKPKENSDNAMEKALAHIVMIKQALGGGESYGGEKRSMITEFKEMMQLMTLMQKFTPGGAPAEESMLSKALEALAPVAVAAVGAMANRQPVTVHPNNQQDFRQAPQHQAPVNPGFVREPQEPVIVTEKEVKNTMSNYAEAIKQLIGMLDMLGADNVDPMLIAEKICADIPDDGIPDVVLWVCDKECFSKLAAQNPRVADFKDWFLDLIEHVKAQLGVESSVDHLYDQDEPGEKEALKSEQITSQNN